MRGRFGGLLHKRREKTGPRVQDRSRVSDALPFAKSGARTATTSRRSELLDCGFMMRFG